MLVDVFVDQSLVGLILSQVGMSGVGDLGKLELPRAS